MYVYISSADEYVHVPFTISRNKKRNNRRPIMLVVEKEKRADLVHIYIPWYVDIACQFTLWYIGFGNAGLGKRG